MIRTNFIGSEVRRQALVKLFQMQKVFTFGQLAEKIDCNERTVRRYLKQLNGITSYTHSGRYITLASIPKFDASRIWFYRGIGFTKFTTSLELIVWLINSSKSGMTREEIQRILKIQVFQQIQVLLARERLHRVKVGNKYVYIPEKAATNKKKRLRIVGSLQVEEQYNHELKISDIISVLKVVLQEGKIDIKLVKQWIKKYSLKIPAAKLEHYVQKYKFEEKKTR